MVVIFTVGFPVIKLSDIRIIAGNPAFDYSYMAIGILVFQYSCYYNYHLLNIWCIINT
jgi:hypothetical protein